MSKNNIENHMVMNNDFEEEILYCDNCGAENIEPEDDNCSECGQHLISKEERKISWEEDRYRDR